MNIFKQQLLTEDVEDRVIAMIDEVYRELHPNPLNRREVGFANRAQDKAVFVELDNYHDSVYVMFIRATPQGGGMGTQMMDYLKDKAKKHNVPLTATPWRHGTIPESTLRRIITQRWGFKRGKGGLLWWNP